MTLEPSYWRHACQILSERDPVMGAIIERFRQETLSHLGDPFVTLARAIVGQQISVKAADSVWDRLQVAVPDFVPSNVAMASPEVLRACGLSAAKTRYIQSVALAFLDGFLQKLNQAGDCDDQIEKLLLQLPGVGPWTAQMFMIFYLHRPDVLPLKDVGLLKAIVLSYGEDMRPEAKEFKGLQEAWKPYRTVATWYLWRSLDPNPVQY